LAGDDIGGASRIKLPDTDDCASGWIDPPRDHRVECHDDLRDREDRVTPVVWVGTVCALPFDDDFDQVAGGVDGPVCDCD
jgi:hypothetical protein